MIAVCYSILFKDYSGMLHVLPSLLGLHWGLHRSNTCGVDGSVSDQLLVCRVLSTPNTRVIRISMGTLVRYGTLGNGKVIPEGMALTACHAIPHHFMEKGCMMMSQWALISCDWLDSNLEFEDRILLKHSRHFHPFIKDKLQSVLFECTLGYLSC